MRWKKLLITAALFWVVLIAAAYVILLNLDFNRYKPRIAQLVFDATGRRLTIDGNINVALGVRPTLVAENVGLENAGWGSQPDLVRVKRLEAQLAFLPLIWGKLDFAHLVLVEPEVIVEFDKAGTSNFAFDTLSEEKESQKIPPPPLIFSDIQIEKGFFVYRDTQSDIKFSVRIDRLEGEIEGFDKPLRLDFKGAIDEFPLALAGTVGPIWAWVEPGYSLPANLTVTAGGTTATITGELRDPINMKGVAFDMAARGSSVAELARQAGISGVPKFGAFNLTAILNDSAGHLAVEKLDIQIGDQELVAISIAGDLKDVISLRGVDLNFSAHGQDSAQLTQLGLPALPLRGAYRITAQVSDSEANAFKVDDLKAVLGENEVNGQLNLSLAHKVPLLTASLTSQKLGLGPFNLDFSMTGPLEKPAIKKIDLKLGTSDLAEIRFNGAVDDLINLQGVKINFKANGKDLANLAKFTGKPLPVRGAFSANGMVLIPVHKKLQIPDLKISIGKNNITGSLTLDLSGARPLLDAKLSSSRLDLPSVLLPKLAKEGWAKGLGLVQPVKLEARLSGFAPEVAVKKVELQAGTLASAKLRLTGTVENLLAQHGIDLNFFLQGNEFAKLKEILAQPYIFAPMPGQGTYAISGKVNDTATNQFKVSDFKFVLADTQLTGWLDFNLAAQPPQYEVDLSAPTFNLKPFPIPRKAAYANLNKIDDLGPLKLHSKMIVEGNQLSLSQLELQAGSEQMARVEIKGSIKNLTEQNGIDLDFSIQGNEIANLSQITGHSIPLKGAYGLSGSLTDPAKKSYKISDLGLKLGENHITGSLDLNLGGKQPGLDLSAERPHLSGELSSDKLDLRPFWGQDKEKSVEKSQAGKPVSTKEKKLKLSKSDVQDVKVFSDAPLKLEGLLVVDADIKFQSNQILLPALALDDVILDVLLENGNLEIKPFKFSIGGRKADVQFALRSKEKPPRLAATLAIDQLEIGPMLDKLGYQRSVEGNMDAAINLDGSGDSVAALMAGLNGNTRIAMRDGRAASAYLDLLEKYLGSGILRMLNPFQETREYTPVNCFVNTIEIKDGQADVKILLDTDRTSIFGLGDVNLKTERLDLGIKPTPKKGAGPASISFSFRKLSQPFRLGGTLAQPSLVIDAGRTAFVIGKMAGAVALGPVGITAFFADVSMGKKDPCAVALGTAAIKGQPLDANQAGNSSKETAAGGAKKEEKKSGGLFRRLFSR